jgi:hypothetical protein
MTDRITKPCRACLSSPARDGWRAMPPYNHQPNTVLLATIHTACTTATSLHYLCCVTATNDRSCSAVAGSGDARSLRHACIIMAVAAATLRVSCARPSHDFQKSNRVHFVRRRIARRRPQGFAISRRAPAAVCSPRLRERRAEIARIPAGQLSRHLRLRAMALPLRRRAGRGPWRRRASSSFFSPRFGSH